MKALPRLLALAACLLASPGGWAQAIVFIDPGKSDEVYWVTAANAMKAAADELGMRLEVRYAEQEVTSTEVASLRDELERVRPRDAHS